MASSIDVDGEGETGARRGTSSPQMLRQVHLSGRSKLRASNSGSIRISQADFRRIDGTLGRLGALARLWPLSTVRRGTGVALTKVTRRCCGQHARAVTTRLSIDCGFAG